MDLPLVDWMAAIEQEYVETFIPAGGAAVKFTVLTPPLEASDIRQGLKALADRHGLAYFGLDGAETRLHMIDQLFHAIARQVDWENLAGALMRRLLAADGYLLPSEAARCTYPEIAAMNGTSDVDLRRRVRVLLHEHVENDYAMVHEFRAAMLRLCQAYLEVVKAEVTEIESIQAWLRGELKSVSVLKPAGIFQKVGRNLARDMFLSLAHWLKLVRPRGTVLALDISRYSLERRFSHPDGLLFHSTTAVVDVYEVLRQFIDATDELESCLIVVIAPPAFLTDEKRGLAKYNALKLRLWDDVRDRARANPLSAMVRIAGEVA